MSGQRQIAATVLVLTAVLFSCAASAGAAVYWTEGSLIGRADNDGSNADQTVIGELGSMDWGAPAELPLVLPISIGRRGAEIGSLGQI